MDNFRTIKVAAAIIERGGDVLLVRQQGAGDPEPVWAFPGGMVETGETLFAGLKREVFEETGLTLVEVAPTMAYVVETFHPDESLHILVFVFRGAVADGSAPIDDPDGLILEAQFVPRAEAIVNIGRHHYLPMNEPPVAFLRGEDARFWSYRVVPSGIELLTLS